MLPAHWCLEIIYRGQENLNKHPSNFKFVQIHNSTVYSYDVLETIFSRLRRFSMITIYNFFKH